MPQYIRGTCKKCGTTTQAEIKDTPEALRRELAEPFPYECPGQHQEFGPMLKDYEWDWTPFQAEEPMTDEEYGSQLIQRHGKDKVHYLGQPAIGNVLGIRNLNEVRDLEHLGFGDFANAEHYYLRHDSPRHTTRFYVQERR